MLSEENKNKLCMTGLYKHEPDKKYRGTLYWDNLFHCCNWTFKVHKWNDGRLFMYDTYWSDDSALHIEITDDNIDEFEFLFDFNNVEKHSGTNIYDYEKEDWWHVAVDSGGMYCGGKFFVRKNAIKNKDKVLNRLKEEIDSMERELEYKKKNYEDAKSGSRGLKYI